MKRPVQFTLPPIHGWRVAIIKDERTRKTPIVGAPQNYAQVFQRVVDAASGLGIRTLSLVADSSDKWLRPDTEAYALLRRIRSSLAPETSSRQVEPAPRPADPVHDYWLR
jgi:undecaprenyl pyrophosphate synthase